ncbi:hypothetical protein MJG53_010378 [Ovis ammon polii x Ovis aries]|uniref:Uncharacterized protein n=1 Tax=Ovis ammon polii x Ovis aries TaxID=2918886 RepID=A0ACB9UUH2_9CETA|nr:hypothetical protein MJG53_010378 [Ovis ammon polii x Ovis aries]
MRGKKRGGMERLTGVTPMSKVIIKEHDLLCQKLLHPHTATTKASTPGAHTPQQEKPLQPKCHSWRAAPPLSTTRDSPGTAARTQHKQKESSAKPKAFLQANACKTWQGTQGALVWTPMLSRDRTNSTTSFVTTNISSCFLSAGPAIHTLHVLSKIIKAVFQDSRSSIARHQTTKPTHLGYKNMLASTDLKVVPFCTEAEDHSQSSTVDHPAQVGKLVSESQDFPGSPMVKNPPANAEDVGFDPWSRKIPHSTGQRNACVTTTEPAL